MNQGKMEVVKQEMARVNIDILGISELKWTGMGEFNSDNDCIYYCGQESLRRNRVAIMVNKRVRNTVLGCNLKNDRMISVRFQGKSFNITVIQVYAPTSNAEEAEVERFYEDLQDLLELTPKKDVLFIVGIEAHYILHFMGEEFLCSELLCILHSGTQKNDLHTCVSSLCLWKHPV